MLGTGQVHPPDIRWEYTVQRPKPEERFRWAHADAWTPCDAACNGERRREEQCVRLDSGGEVAAEYCASLARPAVQSERCNPCTVQWHAAPSSPCSATCGRGQQARNVQCLQTQLETRMTAVVADSACAHLPRPAEVADCEQPACEHYVWKYGKWREVSALADAVDVMSVFTLLPCLTLLTLMPAVLDDVRPGCAAAHSVVRQRPGRGGGRRPVRRRAQGHAAGMPRPELPALGARRLDSGEAVFWVNSACTVPRRPRPALLTLLLRRSAPSRAVTAFASRPTRAWWTRAPCRRTTATPSSVPP